MRLYKFPHLFSTVCFLSCFFAGPNFLTACEISSADAPLELKGNSIPGISFSTRMDFRIEDRSADPLQVGRNPFSMTSGDFNNDKFLDLAVASFDSNDVYVLLNDGKGGFGTTRRLPIGDGSGPMSVVAGDFNKDGFLDLATANFNSSTISILLGNEDGFDEVQNIPLETQPRAITVGDFDGDDILDLASANFNSDSISILIGKGDGDFEDPKTFPASQGPRAIFSQDLDRDSVLDLITINSAPGTLNSISILFGKGDGSFYPPVSLGFGERIDSLTMGDFNGDHSLDLAVGTSDTDRSMPKVVIVNLIISEPTPNGPSVTFNRLGEVPLTGGPPVSITAGDFDSDKILDLATANDISSDVSILLGKGDGTFDLRAAFPISGSPRWILAEDFNGDGVLDIATANSSTTENSISNVSILIGNGAAEFTAPMSLVIGPPSKEKNDEVVRRPNAIAVADFNDDGFPDLAVATSAPNKGYVSIYLGDGKAGFAPATDFGVGLNPQAIAVADFDSDGNLDLAVVNAGSDSVSILLGDGQGGFGEPEDFKVGSSPKSIAVEDFDGDGHLDLAVVNRRSTDHSNDITILRGLGNGQFESSGTLSVGTGDFFPQAIAVEDFDNDRILDLAVTRDMRSGNGSVVILRGEGDGGFTLAGAYDVGAGPISIAAADFDGDGNMDLAVACLHSFPDPIWILKGDGKGAFTTMARLTVGGDPRSVLVADFNNDRIPDLAVANRQPNNISVLLNDGKGGFIDSSPDFGTDLLPVSIAVGDFNSDGYMDLAAACFGSSRISILLQNASKLENISKPEDAWSNGASESLPRSSTVWIDTCYDRGAHLRTGLK